ncbi:MAG: carbon monoxide dehydrogenase subunit G [Rhodospirillaceae bacterium]|nr:carbon monoxide dehydrogenase subunit G [Rhodospirillaceae bacterium]
MKIAGSFNVAAPVELTWRAITDPQVVGACLPGCEEIEAVSPTLYRARIGVKLGPISATFAAEVEVLEEEPPVRVVSVTRGEEGGRASHIRSENTLTLEPADDGGTRVSYEADMTVTGRLAKFGFGVMKKKAQSLAADFAGNLEARLNEAASGG